MKKLFAFCVFLSCSAIMWAHSFESEMTVGDTIVNDVYDLDPEMKEEEYSQKPLCISL